MEGGKAAQKPIIPKEFVLIHYNKKYSNVYWKYLKKKHEESLLNKTKIAKRKFW